MLDVSLDESDVVVLGHDEARSNPLAAKSVITPEDPHGAPFIALSTEDRMRRKFEATMKSAGFWPRIVVETPGSATICALALHGVGIGLEHPVAADGFPELGLAFKPFEPAIHFRTMLLFRPDAQKSLLVKGFVADLYAARDIRLHPPEITT